jgi:4-hydroxyphenylacetate 3-monooxygenase
VTARTGEEYLEGLRTHPRDIWIEGEQVNDVTTHPAFARCARSIAALYDMQFDANSAKMTFPSPATGDPVGMSFLEPRTKTDLEERNEMMLSWAKLSGGMLG